MKRPRWIGPTLVAVALAALTLAVFGQASNHAFVNFDDDVYLTGNPVVRNGLSQEGIAWAFTTFHSWNWHPLTWMSHMLDVELFGMDAGRHHLASVLIHGANAIVLFLALHAMTGALWPSALAAALFAVHPLHVESVAWAAERKDVLSTLFWLLATAAYVRYARRPGAGRYLAVLALFSLGLLSKPMLVTLPLALLLLDWWPLGRFPAARSQAGPPAPFPTRPASRLLLEKIPLLALAAASAAVTFVAQRSEGAMVPLEAYSVGSRLANVPVSYASYLVKTVWPASLAVFYPHPASVHAAIPAWQVAGSVLLLGALSVLALREARRRPCLAVGWLWYLGTLVPVIGLVQVGAQAMADRYTYVPLIGIFVAAAWGMSVALPGRRYRRHVLGTLACLAVAALSAASWVQVGTWRDSVTLFTHAVRVTENNWKAWHNLGAAYWNAGALERAVPSYREALRIRPDYPNAKENLDEALRVTGRLATMWRDLGAARRREGNVIEAVACYERAVQLRPDSADAWSELAAAYRAAGRHESAAKALLSATRPPAR